MKKIALLGVENSHANTFLGFIKKNPEFSDIEVVGIYSNEPEASAKLAAEYGVPVLENYDSACGKVDGIIITARHGDNHYKYAKPYVKYGVPMFIDKPITVSEQDAIDMVNDLVANKISVTGGSSVRHDPLVAKLREDHLTGENGATVGGCVRAPLSPDSPYGGFFFYAQHLAEVVCDIFGRYPESVVARTTGKTTTVLIEYADFAVTGVYGAGSSVYYAQRLSENGECGGALGADGMSQWFYAEFEEYVRILRGEKQTMSYSDFIAPVFLLNAIYRSLSSGNRESVNRYSVD